MKKRLVAILMTIAMVGTMATGCGGKDISDDNIKISQYKGLEVDKVKAVEVTDADVEDRINTKLQENKEVTEVKDRAVKKGDTATIDFVGKVDGKKFDGGEGKDYPLEIGSNSFIEGFEEQIIGHKIGKKFDVDVTFPDPYKNNEKLSGAKAVFTVTIKSISKSKLPELNDEFVKKVSEKSKTVDEYKKEVKKALEKESKDSAKTTLSEECWEALLKNTEVTKYPEDKLKKAEENMRATYEQYASYYQMELSKFITDVMQTTEEQYEKDVKTGAKDSVKRELATNLIAKKEKLVPSDKEYEEKYKELAKQYGYEDVDSFKKAVNEDAKVAEETLNTMVLNQIVGDFLVDNCKQVEPKKEDTSKKDSAANEDTSKDTDAKTEDDAAQE